MGFELCTPDLEQQLLLRRVFKIKYCSNNPFYFLDTSIWLHPAEKCQSQEPIH
jgi:hypothetical protein